MLKREDVKLNLTMDRTKFVRGESIDIVVSVKNESAYKFRAEELSQRNNSLHFYVMNYQKEKFSGSLQTPLIAEGQPNEFGSEEDTIMLFPNTEMSAEIDLLDILGELPEGTYQLRAIYSSQGVLFVKSKTVAFDVLNAKPIYASTTLDYLRSTSNRIPTSWINQENGDFWLFLMENSQYNPSKTKSNRRILKVEAPQKVYASIIQDNEQNTQHLVWMQKSVLNVTTAIQKLTGVRTFDTSTNDAQILPPTFTDQEKTAHITIKDKQTKTLQHISCAIDGEFRTEKICNFDDNFSRYSAVFDETPALHIAWSSESGDVLYTEFILNRQEESAKPTPIKLLTLKPPLLTLELSKGHENLEGERLLLLHLANYESTNELHSLVIEIDTLKTVRHCFSSVPQDRGFLLLQTVLDFELNPYYLFQDRKGALWFKGLKGRGFLRITKEGESYPSNIEFPLLIVSSNINRNYGVYLRYVKDKSKFIYKKLVSLA